MLENQKVPQRVNIAKTVNTEATPLLAPLQSELNEEGEASIEIISHSILPLSTDDLSPSLTLSQVLKRIFGYGLTTAFSYTFSMGIGIVGFWGPYVAKESNSTDVLGALSLVTNIKSLMTKLTITSLYAISVLGSVKVGQLRKQLQTLEKQENLDKSRVDELSAEIAILYRNGIIWGLVISAPLSMVYYFSKAILMGIGQPEAAASIAQTYLRPYTPALMLGTVRVCAQEVLFSFGQSKVAMLLALPSLAVSMGLAATLIYGFDMGLEGLAYGFLSEAALTAITFNAYLFLSRGDLKNIPLFKIFFKSYQAFFKDLGQLLKVGGIITLQSAGLFVVNTLTDLLAGRFGKTSLAAQNFVTQYSFLLMPFVIAFGQSIMQEVGRLRGAHQYADASYYARIGLGVSLALAIIPGIIVVSYPKLIVDIFSRNVEPDVLSIAINLLRIAAIGRIADAGLYNIIQVSRQAGDRNIPTFIALFETLGLGVTAGYLLGTFTDLDIYGVNLGYFGGLALSFASLAYRWYQNTTTEHLSTTQQIQEGALQRQPSWLESGCHKVSSCFTACCSFFSTASRNQNQETKKLNISDKERQFVF